MGNIAILREGLLSTIQDSGRFGLRHLGIPWSGALTPAWQALANSLVGNPPSHSIIECFEGGLKIKTGNEPVRIAVIGCDSLKMNMTVAGEESALAIGRSYTVPPDSLLSLTSTGNYRHAILAIHGLQIEKQLGSTATYAKASLGGVNGRALSAGDNLPVSSSLQGPELQCRNMMSRRYMVNDIRVVPGPQDDHFSDEGMATFFSSGYSLSPEVDRMGARLQGDPLSHINDKARDIVSDAIVPGSIQVPGSGQPIVLLNDAHTAGGYPKIATVASVDLPLLGLRRPGTIFRFQSISAEQAVLAVRQEHKELQQAIASISPITTGVINSELLFTHNLIGGVVDGTE